MLFGWPSGGSSGWQQPDPSCDSGQAIGSNSRETPLAALRVKILTQATMQTSFESQDQWYPLLEGNLLLDQDDDEEEVEVMIAYKGDVQMMSHNWKKETLGGTMKKESG